MYFLAEFADFILQNASRMRPGIILGSPYAASRISTMDTENLGPEVVLALAR